MLKKFQYSLIHGPSLAIGATVASVALIVVFLGFDTISNESELVLEPTPIIRDSTQTIQEFGPP